jgi:hypothetical protein
MPYTAQKPATVPSSDELRRTIHGWGVDLDPKDRPAVPRERLGASTGAHWDFPERQPELTSRERSTEHMMLPPVFGTSVPLRYVSGAVRRLAYRRYSEGQMRHWLLLVLGDRIDVVENRLLALMRGRPDNPITQSGILAEVRRNGLRSRLGQHRADLKHQPLDLVLQLAPWALLGTAAFLAGRKLVRARRESRGSELGWGPTGA